MDSFIYQFIAMQIDGKESIFLNCTFLSIGDTTGFLFFPTDPSGSPQHVHDRQNQRFQNKYPPLTLCSCIELCDPQPISCLMKRDWIDGLRGLALNNVRLAAEVRAR